MPKPKHVTINQASAITALAVLQAEKDAGYEEGIADGLRIAERIYAWWAGNHELKEPRDVEELKSWSQAALLELRKKLK